MGSISAPVNPSTLRALQSDTLDIARFYGNCSLMPPCLLQSTLCIYDTGLAQTRAAWEFSTFKGDVPETTDGWLIRFPSVPFQAVSTLFETNRTGLCFLDCAIKALGKELLLCACAQKSQPHANFIMQLGLQFTDMLLFHGRETFFCFGIFKKSPSPAAF